MYMDSAYWRNSRVDIMDKKHPLLITSCGTYQLLTRPKLPTHRPKGRLNFNSFILPPEKHIFTLMEKRKLSLRAT